MLQAIEFATASRNETINFHLSAQSVTLPQSKPGLKLLLMLYWNNIF